MNQMELEFAVTVLCQQLIGGNSKAWKRKCSFWYSTAST